MNKTLVYALLALVLVGALYMLLSKEETTSLASNALTDYAIKDTASIGSIYIADRKGGEVTLARGEDNFWLVNNTHRILPHQIKMILKTFHGAGIQQPVSKTERETVMNVIAGDNRKVKVFDLDGNWIKTWYVGRATVTSQGTYALLETPEDGLSPEPMVIETRAFRGYLTNRFHTKVKDWRWLGVFYHPEGDIASIEVKRPRTFNQGFSIDVEDRLNGKMRLLDEVGRQLPADGRLLGEYVDQFKRVNAEHFIPDLTPLQMDSMLQLPPDYHITVTNKAGEEQSAKVYHRPTPAVTRAKMAPNAPVNDPERVFVQFNGEVASAQRLLFDPILKERKNLMGNGIGPLR